MLIEFCLSSIEREKLSYLCSVDETLNTLGDDLDSLIFTLLVLVLESRTRFDVDQ